MQSERAFLKILAFFVFLNWQQSDFPYLQDCFYEAIEFQYYWAHKVAKLLKSS